MNGFIQRFIKYIVNAYCVGLCSMKQSCRAWQRGARLGSALLVISLLSATIAINALLFVAAMRGIMKLTGTPGLGAHSPTPSPWDLAAPLTPTKPVRLAFAVCDGLLSPTWHFYWSTMWTQCTRTHSQWLICNNVRSSGHLWGRPHLICLSVHLCLSAISTQISLFLRLSVFLRICLSLSSSRSPYYAVR